MKVLGFSAITYVGSFWKESLLSIEPFIDKMHISYSRNPSHGHSTLIENPESEYEIRKIAEEVLTDKLIWESASGYTSEEEHRKQRYKYAIGYSLIVSIDPDEIFDTNMVLSALNYAYTGSHRYYGTHYFIHFWKSFNWCFFNDGDSPQRIENLMIDNTLVDKGCPLKVYHTNMMQSEELLNFKFDTFGHKNEIKSNYLQEKFLVWSPEKINEITHLHPVRDDIWIRPEPFTGELPESLKNYKPKIKQKMKILWIPLDYQRHIESPELFTDILNALNTTCQCIIYTGIMESAVRFKPDVILFAGSMALWELGVLKEATNALVLMQTGDCRYAPMQSLMDYRSVIDAYLVPFGGELLNTYTTLLGKPCHFLWESIQNWRFKTPKMMDEGIVTFIGNRYDNLPGGEGRKDLVDFIEASGININCFGNGFDKGEIPNNEVPDIYNNSYIVIAENNHEIENYFTPRNIGGVAAGSCVLMKYFPGIEKFFQNLNQCIYYKDKYELLQCIEFLKNNPEFRNNIASQGFGLALTNFTTDNWAKDFIKIINTYYIK